MVKISVIIPIFNGGKYIKNCIQCLQNQTLSEFEIILVNDGSTDDTANICDNLATEDSRIKVIHQENSGVSIARNNAIQKASGEFLYFIDCDDYVDNNHLELLYNACIDNNVKMSACCIESINENREVISRKSLKKGHYTCEQALEELFKFKNLNSGPSGKLYHKSLFEDNLRFPLLHTYEDLLFVYKSIYKANNIYFIENCKYYYIHRVGVGAMDKFIKSPTTDVIIAASEVLEFIKQNVPNIWDSSFYGMISQVIMYINDINKIDPKWKKETSKTYIRETKKLLAKYRKDIRKNKSIFFKEKIMFLIFSYSSTLYRKILKARKRIK